MYKLIVGLLILGGLTFAATSGTTPVTANRIVRAAGVPSAGTCNTAASVGKVYVRTDAGAANSTFYVCANTASMTYAWELGGGGGGGGGCTPAGTSGQPLTDNGAGGCNSVNSLSLSGSISTGVGGTVAGFWQCTQGTAHTADANSSGFQCPASVTTAYMMNLPAAPITGYLYSTGTSDPTTISFRAIAAGDVPAVLFTIGTSVTMANNQQIFECSTTCTITLPVPVAGVQYCARNANNISTIITFAALGSSARYENTATTGYGTAGTGTFISSGAVGDKACFIGKDSTHYDIFSYNGTWTAN